MIFEYVIDFDASSLYPSIIITFNISPNVSYGSIKLIDDDGNNITNELMDDFMSCNPIKFANKWYNLPNISEMYNELKIKLKED